MREYKVSARCPIRTTLEMVGGKWKLLIIVQLAGGPLRLTTIRQAIPDISEKMLIQELKYLVDNKLVHRENFGEVPPRVEYSLTEAGRAALPLLDEMKRFAERYEEVVKI